MSKILINGRFLCRKPTGVDRFATELLRVIDQWCHAGATEIDLLSFEIIVPKRPLMHWRPDNIPMVEVGPFHGHGWEQVTLAMRQQGDLLLSLCNTGPVFSGRHIVAIHDATPVRVPGSFSWAFRALYRLLMPALGYTARRVLTVSEFSKSEIGECYGIAKEKVRVIANSGEQVLRSCRDDRILDRLGLRDRPFALAVATQAKHKNMDLLIEVASRLRGEEFKIVLVGGMNDKVFSGSPDISAEHVVCAGFVSDDELRALYESAFCFVFPSLYEGFGIPPLEAMHAGCPVISSDAAAMPEVLGGAAIYVSPSDPEALHQALLRVFHDAGLRASMIERGRKRAMTYCWESSARDLLAICREVLVEDVQT